MKKGFFKTFAAVAMAAIMTLGMASAAMASSTDRSSDVGGDGEFEDVIYSVVVPTNLDFAVDTLGISSPGQITIANRTKVPVLVSYDLVLTMADGVTFGSAGELNADGFGSNTKEIVVGLLGAKSVSGTISTPGQLENLNFTFATQGELEGLNYATGGQIVLFTENEDGEYSAFIDFALNKGTGTLAGDVYPNLTAATGYSAFSIYTEANSYADWDDGDISVEGTYNLTPIHADTYKDDVTGKTVGVNQMWIAPAKRPTVIDGGVASYDAAGYIKDGNTVTTLGSSAAVAVTSPVSTEIKVPFFADGKTKASVVVNQATGTPTWNVAIAAEIVGNELVIAPTAFVAKDRGQTYRVDLKLTGDTTTYTFYLKLES